MLTTLEHLAHAIHELPDQPISERKAAIDAADVKAQNWVRDFHFKEASPSTFIEDQTDHLPALDYQTEE
jgi:hypothetical protein